MDTCAARMIWVCEDHQTGSGQPINTLVDISARRIATATHAGLRQRFLCCSAPQSGQYAARLARMASP